MCDEVAAAVLQTRQPIGVCVLNNKDGDVYSAQNSPLVMVAELSTYLPPHKRRNISAVTLVDTETNSEGERGRAPLKLQTGTFRLGRLTQRNTVQDREKQIATATTLPPVRAPVSKREAMRGSAVQHNPHSSPLSGPDVLTEAGPAASSDALVKAPTAGTSAWDKKLHDTGVCHCNKCSHAWRAPSDTGARTRNAPVIDRTQWHKPESAGKAAAPVQVRYLLNPGGVALPTAFTCGMQGKTRDALQECVCHRCGGQAISPTHPASFRWYCKNCGWHWVEPRWYPSRRESVPPLSSHVWVEHAVTVREDRDTVVYCLGEVWVLAVPVRLALTLRDMARQCGLASETAASYASLQWCATRLRSTTGETFGARAMGPVGLPARVVATVDGGWYIDDSATVKLDQWVAASTVEPVVSIGLAMDERLQQLTAAVVCARQKELNCRESTPGPAQDTPGMLASALGIESLARTVTAAPVRVHAVPGNAVKGTDLAVSVMTPQVQGNTVQCAPSVPAKTPGVLGGGVECIGYSVAVDTQTTSQGGTVMCTTLNAAMKGQQCAQVGVDPAHGMLPAATVDRSRVAAETTVPLQSVGQTSVLQEQSRIIVAAASIMPPATATVIVVPSVRQSVVFSGVEKAIAGRERGNVLQQPTPSVLAQREQGHNGRVFSQATQAQTVTLSAQSMCAPVTVPSVYTPAQTPSGVTPVQVSSDECTRRHDEQLEAEARAAGPSPHVCSRTVAVGALSVDRPVLQPVQEQPTQYGGSNRKRPVVTPSAAVMREQERAGRVDMRAWQTEWWRMNRKVLRRRLQCEHMKAEYRGRVQTQCEAQQHIRQLEREEAAVNAVSLPRQPPPLSVIDRAVATQQLVDDWEGTFSVPAMLNHERLGVEQQPNLCRGSKKTVSTTPPTPMLIWHAKAATQAMVETVEVAAVAELAARIDLSQTMFPFAEKMYGASPLWDACVSGSALEATSMGQQFSVYTPVHGDASAVNKTHLGLDADAIARVLHWHPQAALISNGARFGFSLMSDGAVRRQEWSNPSMSEDEAAQVTAWIEKQKANGRTVQIPDSELDELAGLFISPVALAPKTGGEPGEMRICHNMSAGGAMSVNSGIDFDPLNPIGLLQLDSVVARIQFMKAQCPTRRIMGSKCDMKEFFRQIPLRRRDMARVVQRWQGVVYAHESFTFGSSSAPHICSVVTNAICDELSRRGIYCQCFIDDCVLIAYEDEIGVAVEALQSLIREFGLVENVTKFVPPTQQLAIVGVQFDLEAFTVGIAPEKRVKTLLRLAALVKGPKTTVGQLREIAGKLAFLSAVVPFARCYTAFFWAAAGGALRPAHELVTVNKNISSAVQWWRGVLNGERFTVTDLLLGTLEKPLSITSAVTSDASKYGFAGVDMIHKFWMQDVWRAGEVVDRAQINIRECFGTLCWVAALAETGVLSGTVVVFETDNECSVWGINKGHSNTHVLNFLVAAMHVLQERYRFLLVMKHIPGVLNVLSDRLSRNVDPSSLQLSASTGWRRLPIPSSVRKLLSCALTSFSSGHVLDVRSDGPAPVWTSLWNSVLESMRPPSAMESSHSIPWIPYLDCSSAPTTTEPISC